MKSIVHLTITLFLGFSATLLLIANDPPQTKTTAELERIYESISDTSPKPQINDAIQYLKEILPQLDTTSPSEKLGKAYHHLGKFHYFLGETNSVTAIYYIKKAIEVRSKLQETTDQQTDLGKSYYNLGLYNYEPTSKNIPESIKSYEHAVSLFLKTNQNNGASKAYHDLGKIYEDRGDYSEAISYYQLAQKLAINTLYKAQALMGEGRCLNYIDQFAKALLLFDNAIPLIPKDEKREHFVAYENLGIGYEYNGNTARAIEFYKKALPYVDTLSGDDITMANDLGRAYRKNENYDKALSILEMGLKIAEKRKDFEKKAYLLDNIGEVFIAQKNYPKALAYFEQAEIAILNGVTMDSSGLWKVSVHDKSMLFTSLYDKGRALSQISSGSYLALKAFEDADKVVSAMRREQYSEVSKLSWRKKVSDLYAAALEICENNGLASQAFFFIENSKSALLADQLAALSTKKIIGPYYDNRLTELQNELLIARNEFSKKPGLALKNQIISIQNELKAVQDTISLKYPEYAATRYDTEPIGVDELQKHLNDTTLFISYFVSESKNYAYATSNKEGPLLIPLSLDNKFKLQVDTLLKNAGASNPNQLDYCRVAYGVYQTILEPVLGRFKQNYGKLMLVPDGIIAKLPIDALLSHPYNPVKGLSSAPYLIKNIQTQQVWSATTWIRFAKRGQTSSTTKLALISPRDFKNKNSASLRLSSDLIWDYLKNATAANTTIEFRDSLANLSNFEKIGTKSTILHAHTHASLNEIGRPYLLLFEDTVAMEDFYRMRFETDVCILGACETNLGNYEKAEGVYSLTRAISGAGSSSVISSLWEVNAEYSAEFFIHFYRYLSQGFTKADALHKAKKQLLLPGGTKAVPSNWAAWTFTGTDNPIQFPNKTPINRWFLIGGLLITWLFVMRYFYRIPKSASAK